MSDPHSAFIAAVRQDFPLIAQAGLHYLDNAATTQKPEAVLRAMDDYYRHRNANVHRAAHRLSLAATQAFEQARTTVARFVNAARPEEIIWTRGATEAINLVANTYGETLQRGDRILVSQMEHHANIVPWQLLAERRGVEIVALPLTATGEIDLAAYARLLDARVRLVAVTQVSNALGCVNPVAEMARLAHGVGARVLVDGAQAVAHLAVDLQALDCDFYVFSGHKVYGPTGIGVLYGKYDLLCQLPPWQGGGEMIARVSFDGNRYQLPPLRFEAGTPPIVGAIGLAAALDYLQGLDREQLYRHEQQLMAQAVAGIEALPGLRIIGAPAQRCGSLSFVAEGHHALDIGSYLDQRGVAIRTGHHCCMPLMSALGLDGTARASFACYTSAADVQQLLQSLADYLADESAQPAAAHSAPSPAPNPAANPAQQTPLTDQLRAAPGRDQRHALLMKGGVAPLSDDPELHQERFQLHGCTSRVWLRHQRDPRSGQLQFELDSDARVMRGLLRVLLEAIQGRSPEQLLALDFHAHLAQLGLLQQLSASRTSGLRAIIAALQAIAASYPA